MNEKKSLLNWETADGIHFLATIGIQKGDVVFDFGCGAGHYSVAAAHVVEKQGKVYAVDKNPDVLDALKERWGKNNDLRPIKILQTDGRLDFDIPDDHLDAALVFDVVHMFTYQERTQLFQEIYRMLKKGGLLVIHPTHMDDVKNKEDIAGYPVESLLEEITDMGFSEKGSFENQLVHKDHLEHGVVYGYIK